MEGTVSYPALLLPTSEEISVDRSAPVRQTPALPDESRIIEKAKRGDVRAFEKLYGAYSGRVYATCLRLSGDRDRAEEVTQDVFVRVWKSLGTFEGRSAFGSWLYRITVNQVLDRIRSQKRRDTWEVRDDGIESYPQRGRDPSGDTLRALDDAIATLPPGARTAFVLHDVEGYKHEEIRELTGMAEGTSKSQLHRARRMLREMLK